LSRSVESPEVARPLRTKPNNTFQIHAGQHIPSVKGMTSIYLQKTWSERLVEMEGLLVAEVPELRERKAGLLSIACSVLLGLLAIGWV
jgi:hypothetical protein